MTLRQAAGYRYRIFSVLVFTLWQATGNYQVKKDNQLYFIEYV